MTFEQWWETHRVNTWVMVEISHAAARFVWKEAQAELLREQGHATEHSVQTEKK